MIRLGVAPRLLDFGRGALGTIDTWFNQVTARFNIIAKAGATVLAEVPTNQWGIFKNTTAGTMTLTVNDNGTLKSVDIPNTAVFPATVAPLMDGVAAIGTSLLYARQDHVHPTDTSRAPLASPAFTGVPTAPTAAVDTNTTQIATTAFVVGQAGAAAPLMDGSATVGTSLRYSRQDHIHPSDTIKANLASPTFTGVPAAPTAAVDTNTTQLATTAFVVGQASGTLPVIDGTATIGTSLRYARMDHIHPTDTTRDGRPNLCINGNFTCDQTWQGTAVSVVGSNPYPADMWNSIVQTAGVTCTAQRAAASAVLTPVGLAYMLTHNCTVGAAPAAGNTNITYTAIEGNDFAFASWGSSTAIPIYVGFWVVASVTGTYGMRFTNSANNRSYCTTYTVASAGVAQWVTVTIPGDTTGTWVTNNGVGLYIVWDLGSGTTWETASVNTWGSGVFQRTSACVKLIQSTGTLSISGVQFRPDPVTSVTESQSFEVVLQKVRRYRPVYDTSTNIFGYCLTTINGLHAPLFSPALRTPATGMTLSAGATATCAGPGGAAVPVTGTAFNNSSVHGATFISTVAAGLTAGDGTMYGLSAGRFWFTGAEMQ